MSLILTLRLDERSQAFFEDMRRAHFPPERNQVPAHLTLFHHLPGSDDVTAAVKQTACATEQFPVEVYGLRSLGGGVAYTLASPTLLQLHSSLAGVFSAYLTRQDQQRFAPHIVIQNKAAAAEAAALLAVLKASFQSWTVHAIALDLWQYLGGPWLRADSFDFRASSSR